MSVPASIVGAVELPALPPPPAFDRSFPLRPENRRFFFYSHDGLGLGHVRRNLAVAAALTEAAPEASVLLASSTRKLERLGVPAHVDILKLPALRKLGNERYAARRLLISADDVRALRSALLAAAVTSFGPAVVLVDKHPTGASGELRIALEAARDAGAGLVLGLRDILDDPAVVVEEWAKSGVLEQIPELYDRVLVYGHPAVLDPVLEYGLPPSVRERTLSWAAVVVAGPECGDADSQRLRGLCNRAGVSFRTFVPDLASAFSAVDALVCMGGYNTLTEALASGVPTVCVPRVHPRREQLLRAQAFARLGALTLVEPERLSAALLRAEVEEALRSPRPAEKPARPVVDLQGARRAAHYLLGLAAEHRARMKEGALGAAR